MVRIWLRAKGRGSLLENSERGIRVPCRRMSKNKAPETLTSLWCLRDRKRLVWLEFSIQGENIERKEG